MKLNQKQLKKEIKSITVIYWINDKKYEENCKTKESAHKFVNYAYKNLNCDFTEVVFNY